MKFNKSSPGAQAGQISRLLLVLAIIVLVAVVITFLIIRMAEKPAKPIQSTEPTVPLPVYETTLGDIRFVFESARDRGNILKASQVTNASSYYYQKDLETKAKFIEVTVGAQNKGKENTDQGAWDIGNIIDSEGRNFVPLDSYTVSPWLPGDNSCGSLLKPAFDPLPCTKIYEVSKASSGLKIMVKTGKDNNSANELSSGKYSSFLLDLIVK